MGSSLSCGFRQPLRSIIFNGIFCICVLFFFFFYIFLLVFKRKCFSKLYLVYQFYYSKSQTTLVQLPRRSMVYFKLCAEKLSPSSFWISFKTLTYSHPTFYRLFQFNTKDQCQGLLGCVSLPHEIPEFNL